MKIALDTFMFRKCPITDLAGIAAEAGYEYIELSPREDFLPLRAEPRAASNTLRELKRSLKAANVHLASIMVLYRWSSPLEDERQAALHYWQKAIECALELGCPTINTEFSGLLSEREKSEAAFRRSMEELLPVLERQGVTIHLEAHSGDFVEDNDRAVDLLKQFASRNIRYLYCAPHTFHLGDDMAAMIRHAAPILAHVHVADTFNHKGSSGYRYILNPGGSKVRVHQHLNIGEGEIDWAVFFDTLQQVGFDGIMTSCVFAWEETAMQSAKFMRERMAGFLRRRSPAGESI